MLVRPGSQDHGPDFSLQYRSVRDLRTVVRFQVRNTAQSEISGPWSGLKSEISPLFRNPGLTHILGLSPDHSPEIPD